MHNIKKKNILCVRLLQIVCLILDILNPFPPPCPGLQCLGARGPESAVLGLQYLHF